MERTVEEFVERYWSSIDSPSIENALMVTSYRHRENQKLLRDLRGYENDPTLEYFYREIKDQCQYEMRWRNFLRMSLTNPSRRSRR